MTDWVEIALRVNTAIVDTVAELLTPYGYQGVSIEYDDIMPESWDEGTVPPPSHQIVRAYFPDNDKLAAVQQDILTALAPLQIEAPVYRNISEQDWSEAWKTHYHPLRIGKRIVVRPVWETTNIQPDDIEIVLDPGMAFGTGTHTTTQLCLEAIEDMMPVESTVLDLGCGSGILSIAAAKLGAKSVYAIDIDPVAAEAAEENIEQNNTGENITVATGGLPEVLALNRQFDFAVVNILARIIIQMCDENLSQIVHPGGKAIFAGIIDTQQQDVENALRKTGLTPISARHQGDWVLIEAIRQD